MKITAVRCVEYRGTMEHPGTFWEARQGRPTDIYPSLDANGPRRLPQMGEGAYAMSSIFVHIETDAGLSGTGGFIGAEHVLIIESQLKGLLIGADPLAHERLWDMMYRSAIHGRKGATMQAISAIDCALWDLKGKWAGVPTCVLLGGPTRESLPAYASMLGHSLEPERVAERSRTVAQQGYGAMKWFFRHSPKDGKAGMEANIALARTVREAVGPDVDIMLDAWNSWDVPYTLAMAERLAEFSPRWLEEPVMPDKIASYAEITRRIGNGIAVAGGEHEYTRFGTHQLLEARAMHVYQIDTVWAGGLTEMQKVAALCSAYDVQLIPHGHTTPANLHLLYALPPTLAPLLEYLLKSNTLSQWFLKYPVVPENGAVPPPTRPGLGMELDEAKIESRREVTFAAV